MNFTCDLHHTVMPQNLILLHEGDFEKENRQCILSLAEQRLELLGELPIVKRRVFRVIVEAYQNLIKHRDAQQKPLDVLLYNEVAFSVKRDKYFYLIETCNRIANPKVTRLAANLNEINEYGKKLKEMQRGILKKPMASEKGGAGLGLIDMARKSGEKLVFTFTRLNDKLSLFYLAVKVARENSNQKNCNTVSYGNP